MLDKVVNHSGEEVDMREVTGKVAVVTGAASGIGRAMAQRFARAGMKLVLADIDEKELTEAAGALARDGAEVLAVPTDVSRGEQVEALATRTFAAYGAAHVLCNNAGVGAGGFTWEIPAADWEWVFAVNQWSVVHGIRAFVPRMIAQGEGHVVNTASIAGLLGAPGMAAYGATKHAVVAISESLHLDLGLAGHASKVQVSLLCPGWVKTGIADSARHRPPSHSPRPASTRSPQEQMIDGMVRAAVEGGMPPEEVAEQVLQAILEERFYVLTHPRTLKAVERSMRGMLDGQAPQFDPGAM
jgi:NAD(P)-dependent dehydrogenase (short-subunit alcohol dehydrogenase family)